MKQSSLLIPLVLLFLSSPLMAKDEFSISMKKAGVKKGPSFLSPTSHFLGYGDPVEVLERKGDWIKIKGKGKTGWCHKTCIADRDSILEDIGKGDKIAKLEHKDEVTLAGKGFSETHEEFYKKKNPKANFADVDKLESFETSTESLVKFVEEGGLNAM